MHLLFEGHIQCLDDFFCVAHFTHDAPVVHEVARLFDALHIGSIEKLNHIFCRFYDGKGRSIVFDAFDEGYCHFVLKDVEWMALTARSRACEIFHL